MLFYYLFKTIIKSSSRFIFDIYNGNHFNDVYEQGNISIRYKEDTSDSREFFAYNTTSLMSTVVNGLISTEVKDIPLGT